MPTYSPLLRFVEPANGDLNWGTTVNTGFTELADSAIAGRADIDVTAGNATLTTANGATDEARRMVLNITGTPGTAREVLVPSSSKIYFVRNGANAAVTVKVSGQTGVPVPVNASMVLRVNGTDAVQAIDYLISPILTNVTLNGTSTFGGSVVPATLTTDSVGYTGTPLNQQSTSYTLVAADAGKSVVHPDSDNNPRTFTIPANGAVAFPVGTTITFINMVNTVTIAITTDTLYLAGVGTTGSRTLAPYGMATAVKITSTTWIISGNGLS